MHISLLVHLGYKNDYLSHKKVKNTELAPKYLIEDNHEAIISKETFELAQKIRKDRQQSFVGEDKNLAKYTNKYPFSAMLVCISCSRTLKRRYWNIHTPAERVMQQCGSYIEGKGNCDAKAVYNDVLEGATIKMLNELFIKKTKVMSAIKDAIRKNVHISEAENQIRQTKNLIEEKEILINNLVDMKMKNPKFDDIIFTNKYNELKYDIEELNEVLEKLGSEYIDNFDTSNRLNLIDDFLDNVKNRLQN